MPSDLAPVGVPVLHPRPPSVMGLLEQRVPLQLLVDLAYWPDGNCLSMSESCCRGALD